MDEHICTQSELRFSLFSHATVEIISLTMILYLECNMLLGVNHNCYLETKVSDLKNKTSIK